MALHVGNNSAEGCLFANDALLGRVDQEVARWNDDFAVILWVAEVLGDMLVLFHVFERGVGGLSNVFDRLKWFLVAVRDLNITVLFAHYFSGSLLEYISDTVVGVAFAKQDALRLASLNGVGADVGRVRSDLLRVGILDEPRYRKIND